MKDIRKETREIRPEMVLEDVANIFRSYGFKAEGGRIVRKDENEPESEPFDFYFDEEIPTGMAAFSMDSIKPEGRIYHEEKAGWQYILTVKLGVAYEHPGGGSNGFSKDFILLYEKKYDRWHLRNKAYANEFFDIRDALSRMDEESSE